MWLGFYALVALVFAASAGWDTSPDRDDVTLAIWRLLTSALWPLALVMLFAHLLSKPFAKSKD